MRRELRSTETTTGTLDQDDRNPDWPKCSLCGEIVTRSGWCDSCDRWPINVVPHRFDEQGHLVAPDGFCKVCLQYVMTRLVPERGQWRDTGEVPQLLSREENRRRIHNLMETMRFQELARVSRPRDLAAEKAQILAEEVARKSERPW